MLDGDMIVFVKIRASTRTLRALLIAAVAGLTFASPAPVLGGPSKDEVRTFKKLLATGAKHFDAREYDKALTAFRKAEKIASPPSLKYNIGRTLQALHRCGAARSTFESYLAIEDLSDAKLEKGKKRLQQVEQNCTPVGTLTINCTPEKAKATVFVGDKQAACPSRHEVTAGKHRVAIRADGYEEVAITAEVPAGDSVHHTVTLTEEDVDEPPPSVDTGGNWQRPAQYAGIGVGTALFLGGLATDLGAKKRIRELRDAEANGDAQKVRELQDEGAAAQTRAAIFYTTGAVIALGSGAWLAVDLAGDSDSDDGRAASVRLRPAGLGVAASVRW